jgi:hypothetical protein
MQTIGRFLLPYLNESDQMSLGSVCRDVLEAPPVSWITRHIQVSSKHHPINCCVDSLVIERPNLSKLETIVKSMPQLLQLILVFKKPMLHYNWPIDLSCFKGTLITIGFGHLDGLIFNGKHIALTEEGQLEVQKFQDDTIQSSWP